MPLFTALHGIIAMSEVPQRVRRTFLRIGSALTCQGDERYDTTGTHDCDLVLGILDAKPPKRDSRVSKGVLLAHARLLSSPREIPIAIFPALYERDERRDAAIPRDQNPILGAMYCDIREAACRLPLRVWGTPLNELDERRDRKPEVGAL